MDTVVVGVVAVVGADPNPQVVIGANGRDVALVGALRDEVGALLGARVEVRGPLAANPPGAPGRAIDATGYVILDIGGEKPIVGTLEARGDELWLAGRRLAVAPSELRDAVGGKVWVVGRASPGGLTVQSFGLIRAAGSAPR